MRSSVSELEVNGCVVRLFVEFESEQRAIQRGHLLQELRAQSGVFENQMREIAKVLEKPPKLGRIGRSVDGDLSNVRVAAEESVRNLVDRHAFVVQFSQLRATLGEQSRILDVQAQKIFRSEPVLLERSCVQNQNAIEEELAVRFAQVL